MWDDVRERARADALGVGQGEQVLMLIGGD